MAEDRAPQENLGEELAKARRECARLEEELAAAHALVVQLGKMSELGRMTASIIHEINQPLVGIKSFAQMVRRKMDAGDSNLPKVEFIEQQAIHLEELVDRLRRFSRQASVAREPMDVNGPLRSALDLLDFQLRQKGIRVDRRLGEGLPLVNGNAVQLQQLFVNLLTNSRDAVETVSQKRIVVASSALRSQNGGSVEVLVGDSGVGIPDAIRPRIFEFFFTTKAEEHGTGLGLAICREIAETHGASLELLPAGSSVLDGDPPLRTIFAVRFPALLP